jgi:hypothetical protein
VNDPTERDVRTKYDDTPEGITPEIWMCFCQDATRDDMVRDPSQRKLVNMAWNPWNPPSSHR